MNKSVTPETGIPQSSTWEMLVYVRIFQLGGRVKKQRLCSQNISGKLCYEGGLKLVKEKAFFFGLRLLHPGESEGTTTILIRDL